MNALPPERRQTRPARSASPPSSRTIVATASWGSGESSRRRTARSRASSGSIRRSGWVTSRVSERAVTTTSTRSSARWATSETTSSRVVRSAQCRSSITRRTGARAASPTRTRRTSSSSCPPDGRRRRPAVEQGPQLLAPRLEGGARGEHPVRRVVGGPGEPSQTRGDGPERQLLADVDGGAGDDDPAVGLGARREAPHQPGLAGARVAGEHDGEGAAGARPVPAAGQRGGVGRAPGVGGRGRRRPGAAGNTPLTWHDDRR